MNNCFSIYHTSWITSGPKSNFIGDNIPTKAILVFVSCAEVNSTWLITSELANQRARKVLYILIAIIVSTTQVINFLFICSDWLLQKWFTRYYLSAKHVTVTVRCYWNFWSCLLIVTNKVIIWSASHSALCGTYILKQKKISQLDLSESGAYCSTSFWLKSNLENCTQMCSINGSLSKTYSLKVVASSRRQF